MLAVGQGRAVAREQRAPDLRSMHPACVGIPGPAGCLSKPWLPWPLRPADPQLVVKRPAELACLLAVRNRLAAAVAHREMPPLAEEKRQCNWCFQRDNCALAFRAEGGAAATADAFVGSGGGRGGQADRVQAELAAKYEQAAGHMTQQGERLTGGPGAVGGEHLGMRWTESRGLPFIPCL